jgi:hypothetical protein
MITLQCDKCTVACPPLVITSDLNNPRHIFANLQLRTCYQLPSSSRVLLHRTNISVGIVPLHQQLTSYLLENPQPHQIIANCCTGTTPPTYLYPYEQRAP